MVGSGAWFQQVARWLRSQDSSLSSSILDQFFYLTELADTQRKKKHIIKTTRGGYHIFIHLNRPRESSDTSHTDLGHWISGYIWPFLSFLNRKCLKQTYISGDRPGDFDFVMV